MTSLFKWLFFSCLLALSACSEGEEEELRFTSDITNIRVLDLGDNVQKNDWLINFRAMDPTSIQGAKIFVARTGDYTALSKEFNSNSNFQAISITREFNEIQVDGSLLDAQGNEIVNGVEYSVGFLVNVDGSDRLNNERGVIVPSDDHILKGDFVGTWDDNLYTSFGISAKLSLVGNKFRGPFYYSSNFTSCCSPENDGEISFILDGSQIDNFVYNQSLAQFMGGECPGLYEGAGRLENYGRLIIDFEGDDCEGPHTGGKIVLNKIF